MKSIQGKGFRYFCQSTRATRYRKDESVLEHFGFTYTLRKTDESFTINSVEYNWKIITGVIHDALDFSVIQSFKLP